MSDKLEEEEDKISHETIVEKIDKIEDAMGYFNSVVTNINTDEELSSIKENIEYTQEVCRGFKNELINDEKSKVWVESGVLEGKDKKIKTFREKLREEQKRNRQQYGKIKRLQERVESLNEQIEEVENFDWSKYER